ncbi:MAG: phosphogluconate dehydratase, partial [Colwellia sp.]
MKKEILDITNNIIDRSKISRAKYLAKIEAESSQTVHRAGLSCGNLAHGFAACGKEDKASLRGIHHSDIAIVSAYNDMLSAHQPYEAYPAIIKAAVRDAGGVAQFA